MKTKKLFLSFLLSLVMVLGLMPGMSLTALAIPKDADNPGIDAPIGPSIKTPGSISYPTTSVSKTYGDAVFTNELDKTGDGTVSYESNDTNVATVNSATGAVTIAGAGMATVTATVKDSNDYTYEINTASYTVTVNKANPTNTVGQLSAFVGQTLAEVALPTAENGVWNWEGDTTTTLDELGTTTHFAKFTPNDTNNYNTLENVPVQIEVAEKPMAVPATVTANNRTYDGTEKPLLTVTGEATGGEMRYALGTKDAATEPYATSIPAKTEAGTYYVWYKVVGDDTHNDTEAKSVTSTIAEKDKPAATYKVSVSQAAGGTVSADKETAAEGETVTVTATPTDGYELEAVTVDGEVIDGTSFKMSARDVTVSARFAKKPKTKPEVKPEVKPDKPVIKPDKPETTGAITLTGSGRVQRDGDAAARAEGTGILIGTTGESKRLESFSVSLPAGTDGSIEYRGHVQGAGWVDWAKDGAPCGTTGGSRRVEAVQAKLSGKVADTHSVWYRVHSQTWGWLGWAKDGQAAGTAGQSKRAEAVELQVLPKGQTPSDYVEGQASYVGAAMADVHLQGTGWAGSGSALKFGTTGQARRLEAVRLSLPNQPAAGGISYEVHAQRIGWMGAVADGELAGTEGQSRRLEAVRLSLTGEMARGFSVWYRVHSQTFGWLGWAKDGQDAGTTGLSKRAEAIDVQVLPQGQVPRGYDASKAACVNG